MKELWGRIGMSVKVDDSTYERLKILMNSGEIEDNNEAAMLLRNLFRTKGEIDGNCYLPESGCCDCNPNNYEFDFEY